MSGFLSSLTVPKGMYQLVGINYGDLFRDSVSSRGLYVPLVYSNGLAFEMYKGYNYPFVANTGCGNGQGRCFDGSVWLSQRSMWYYSGAPLYHLATFVHVSQTWLYVPHLTNILTPDIRKAAKVKFQQFGTTPSTRYMISTETDQEPSLYYLTYVSPVDKPPLESRPTLSGFVMTPVQPTAEEHGFLVLPYPGEAGTASSSPCSFLTDPQGTAGFNALNFACARSGPLDQSLHSIERLKKTAPEIYYEERPSGATVIGFIPKTGPSEMILYDGSLVPQNFSPTPNMTATWFYDADAHTVRCRPFEKLGVWYGLIVVGELADGSYDPRSPPTWQSVVVKVDPWAPSQYVVSKKATAARQQRFRLHTRLTRHFIYDLRSGMCVSRSGQMIPADAVMTDGEMRFIDQTIYDPDWEGARRVAFFPDLPETTPVSAGNKFPVVARGCGSFPKTNTGPSAANKSKCCGGKKLIVTSTVCSDFATLPGNRHGVMLVADFTSKLAILKPPVWIKPDDKYWVIFVPLPRVDDNYFYIPVLWAELRTQQDQKILWYAHLGPPLPSASGIPASLQSGPNPLQDAGLMQLVKLSMSIDGKQCTDDWCVWNNVCGNESDRQDLLAEFCGSITPLGETNALAEINCQTLLAAQDPTSSLRDAIHTKLCTRVDTWNPACACSSFTEADLQQATSAFASVPNCGPSCAALASTANGRCNMVACRTSNAVLTETVYTAMTGCDRRIPENACDAVAALVQGGGSAGPAMTNDIFRSVCARDLPEQGGGGGGGDTSTGRPQGTSTDTRKGGEDWVAVGVVSGLAAVVAVGCGVLGWKISSLPKE